jgi:hypothetical protein
MQPAGNTPRLAYDDFETLGQMHADCVETESNLHLHRAAQAAVEPAPSIHFEDYPREVRKRDITIDEATARLANAMHLHLD